MTLFMLFGGHAAPNNGTGVVVVPDCNTDFFTIFLYFSFNKNRIMLLKIIFFLLLMACIFLHDDGVNI